MERERYWTYSRFSSYPISSHQRAKKESDVLFRCILSLTTKYACSSFTNCRFELKSLMACSTGAMCSSSPRYRTPWTLNLGVSESSLRRLEEHCHGGVMMCIDEGGRGD